MTLGLLASCTQIILFSNWLSITCWHLLVLNGPGMDFPQVMFLGCIIPLLLSFLMVRVPSFCFNKLDALTKCTGSVLAAGSNPNSDYVNSGIPYPTKYCLEIFYPAYFKQCQPLPTGIPSSLWYGGPFFNLSLSASNLFDDAENVKHSKVVVKWMGFSTHTMGHTD